MLCPACTTTMLLRDGMYGEFYYCPKQWICKQHTISVEDVDTSKAEVVDESWMDLCYNRD